MTQPLMIQLTDSRTGIPVFIKPTSIDAYGPNHQQKGSVVNVLGKNYFVTEETVAIHEMIEARTRENAELDLADKQRQDGVA